MRVGSGGRAFRVAGEAALVAGLLGLFLWMALTAANTESGTSDEPPHFSSGYSFWLFQDYRLNPENGILPQRWAALPLLWTNPQFADTNSQGWKSGNCWMTGWDMFYERGNDLPSLLRQGRAMIALTAAGLGVLVYFWSRRLFGPVGAAISLVLYVFCPTILSHGRMITSDLFAAAFFLASVGALWRLLHRVNFWTLAASCAAMGLLFVSKHSAVVVIPVALALMALRLFVGPPVRVGAAEVRRWWAKLAVFAGLTAVHAVAVVAVIWAFYGFRYSAFNTDLVGEGGFLTAPEVVYSQTSRLEKPLRWIDQHHLLPQAYTYGFAFTYWTAERHAAFLIGRTSMVGWWYYFPAAVALKTPLAVWVLLALGLWARRARREGVSGGGEVGAGCGGIGRSFYATAPLWALLAVYWAVAMSSHLNIGHRHVLLTYPILYILAGSAGWWLVPLGRSEELGRRVSGAGEEKGWGFGVQGSAEAPYPPNAPDSMESTDPSEAEGLQAGVSPAVAVEVSGASRFKRRTRVATVVVMVCVGWFIGGSLWVRPHYLAYFNEAVGGPSRGYRYLIDSNLDWGQDLPSLGRWLEENHVNGGQQTRTYLSYFGTSKPQYFGVNAWPLPTFGGPPSVTYTDWTGGTYCISASMLQSIYLEPKGPWCQNYEKTYRDLLEKVKDFEAVKNDIPARSALLKKEGEEKWRDLYSQLNAYRLARLCATLRGREPEADIGYSILIYRLTDGQVEAALLGEPAELVDQPQVKGL